jgi:hypothetical protein
MGLLVDIELPLRPRDVYFLDDAICDKPIEIPIDRSQTDPRHELFYKSIHLFGSGMGRKLLERFEYGLPLPCHSEYLIHRRYRSI